MNNPYLQLIQATIINPETGEKYPTTFMGVSPFSPEEFKKLSEAGYSFTDLVDLSTFRISPPEDPMTYAKDSPEMSKLTEAINEFKTQLTDEEAADNGN